MSETSHVTSIEEYRVPGEPGVYFCARHKTVKTRLRCGRCEKPICPKCTQYGPTGARCRDCLSNRSSHMYQVSPLQLLAAFAIALSMCAAGALLIDFIGFFAILYALVMGTFVGKVISRAIKGKRGLPVALVSAAGVLIGSLLPITSLIYGYPPGIHLFNPLTWIYAGLTISGVWYWLR